MSFNFYNTDEEEEVNKILEEFEEEAKSDFSELSPEERAEAKFRYYANLEPDKIITESDIQNNWNPAFMRTVREEGYTKSGLAKLLLKK